MNKLVSLWFIGFLCMASLQGMDRAPRASKSQLASVNKAEPITLYNYCGISNRFAGPGNNDLKKEWTHQILKGQEWRYVIKKGSLKDVPAKLVNYNLDGSLLVAVCRDQTLRLFDLRSNKTIAKNYQNIITGLVLSAKELFLVVSLDNETMEKVNYKGETLKIIKDESMPRVIAMHPEGTHLCTKPYFVKTGVIPKLKIWPLQGGIPLHLDIPKRGINDFAFSAEPGSTTIVGNGIVLRRPHQSEPNSYTVTTIGTQQIEQRSVAVSRKGNQYAGGAYNGTITLSDKDGKVQHVLACLTRDINNKPVTQPVSKLSFTRKGNCLVAASGSNVFLFDIRPELKCWRQIARLPHDDQGLSSVACHPTKNKLVTVCGYNNMQVLERFDNPKFEHILFRLVLKEHFARCLLEYQEPMCPDEREQSTDEAFILWMAHAFNIKTGSLKPIRHTFPEDMRKSIIRTYVYRAKAILALPRVAASVAAKKREEERALEQKNRAKWYWSSFSNY